MEFRKRKCFKDEKTFESLKSKKIKTEKATDQTEFIVVKVEPIDLSDFETSSGDDNRCPKCGISYKSKASMKNHIQVCKQEDLNKNVTGGDLKDVSVVSTFQNGIRKTAEQERKSIKILEQSCFGNVDFDNDVGKADETRQDFKCLECDQEFRLLSLFARHLYAHTFIRRDEEELPCICGGCGREFINKKFLDLHFMTMTECKNVFKTTNPCKVCGKIFTRKDNLREHLRWHIAGEKSPILREYVCNFCLKSYGGSSLLSLHLRTHRGPYPYECPKCFKNFRNKRAFQLHLSKNHGVDSKKNKEDRTKPRAGQNGKQKSSNLNSTEDKNESGKELFLIDVERTKSFIKVESNDDSEFDSVVVGAAGSGSAVDDGPELKLDPSMFLKTEMKEGSFETDSSNFISIKEEPI